MSDYSGPCEKRTVRFTRDWFEVKAGTVVEANHYPELGTYHVPVMKGQFIGTHPSHAGLLEDIRPELTLHVCGGETCKDGQPHDHLGRWSSEDGREQSVACSRCGSAAMHRDMMRLP